MSWAVRSGHEQQDAMHEHARPAGAVEARTGGSRQRSRAVACTDPGSRVQLRTDPEAREKVGSKTGDCVH